MYTKIAFIFIFFSEIDKLNEESVKTLDDIKGLQEYLEKRQKYFTSKQVELKGVSENVKKLNDRMGMSAVCCLLFCLLFLSTIFICLHFFRTIETMYHDARIGMFGQKY